jgi:hypothetical protein
MQQQQDKLSALREDRLQLALQAIERDATLSQRRAAKIYNVRYDFRAGLKDLPFDVWSDNENRWDAFFISPSSVVVVIDCNALIYHEPDFLW